MNSVPAVIKEFLIYFGVVVAVLNFAFTGGVLYQRIVYLEAGQSELKSVDSALAQKLSENDGKFTAILVSLAEIKTSVSFRERVKASR